MKMKQESGSALIAAVFFILSATLLTMAVLAMSKFNTFTIRPHTDLQRSFYINEGAANRIQWLIAADRGLHPVANPGEEDYSEFTKKENRQSAFIRTAGHCLAGVRHCGGQRSNRIGLVYGKRTCNRL